MKILAHRGNFEGSPGEENSLERLWAAIKKGWGVEVDLRWKGQSPYISHDPLEDIQGKAAEPILEALANRCRQPLAINIKEFGYWRETIALLESFHLLDRAFLFDMELVEDSFGVSARTLRKLSDKIHLAARVSDRNEPVQRALSLDFCRLIWLDEFDSFWADEFTITKLQNANRKIFAVSGEIHGFDQAEVVRRWKQFLEWRVDGICSDWCVLLQKMLENES